MTALLLSFLSNPTLLAIFGGVVAVVAAFMKGRLSGAAKERAKQAAAGARAREIADEIHDDIGALPPEVARKKLEQWAKF